MPVRFETVRNVGLTIAPTITSSTSTGSNAASRTRFSALPDQPALPVLNCAPPPAGGRAPAAVVPAVEVSWLSVPATVLPIASSLIGTRFLARQALSRGNQQFSVKRR